MRPVATDAETIEQIVAAIAGDERLAKIFYREERGTLADSSTVWQEYTSVDELPEKPLVAWEELVVFTDEYVHRWVETGYGGQSTTLPRNPDLVVPEPDLGLDD